MSIARAFTTRRAKQSLKTGDLDNMHHRSNTIKGSISGLRHKISSPVELIHTTNMLSYNAPNLYSRSASSATSSHRSDDEMSDGAPTAASTPPTSPDVESSPKRSLSPEPNHLSSYFSPPHNGREASPAASKSRTPLVPQRAPSHTKKSLESLLPRQRSVSRMSEQSQRTVSTKASFTFSRSSSVSTSTAATSQSSATPSSYHQPQQQQQQKPKMPVISPPVAMSLPPQSQNQHRNDFSQSQHPFGSELAQVSEIAEEYGIEEQLNEIAAEEQELLAKGLFKFNASDYLGEVQGLFGSFFGGEQQPRPAPTALWI
ncbi:hypothetical protein B0T17DRAFT_498656 [Bombardia bombarda]|uniref:Uncharacterized protein n=1 Tax=Bombardia bombarda TaxID=252184 RepID=A0AA39TIN6_9PEZI|nr:hypothetical protein B0T17DRAFT_498656 [Bombardia bombarda]